MGLFRRTRHSAPIHVSVAINGMPCAATEPHEAFERRVAIPTDLMLGAWRQLFPAERMMVFGGRNTRTGTHVTSATDVTEARPSRAHVRACPEKLTQCLVDLERTGAHLAVWVHSHPGHGIKATCPSDIDRRQDEDLRRHYGENVVGIVAVEDGWLRVFGLATQDHFGVSWLGNGIERVSGEPHVFRLLLP